jgi:hypothetical protein
LHFVVKIKLQRLQKLSVRTEKKKESTFRHNCNENSVELTDQSIFYWPGAIGSVLNLQTKFLERISYIPLDFENFGRSINM